MKPNKFLQRTFFALGLIFAFGVAIIAGCKKEDLQSPSQQESTTISSATGDTIPPTVSFTFPHAKDTVFDSITIKIKATDSGGVASVQLKVDNVSIGTKTAAPYNFGWNTKKVMNGTHELSAIARDASGNSRTKKITVNTLNAAVLPVEQELLNLINTERANRGLTVLAFNTKLFTAARNHSQDMAKNNVFGHTGSDGSTLSVRLDRVSYPWTGASENLSGGQTIAIDVFNAWMANAGLRANMLDSQMRDGGVGCGYSSKSTSTFHSYWTAVFAFP